MRRRLFWTGVACALLTLAALDVVLRVTGRLQRSATKGAATTGVRSSSFRDAATRKT